MGSGLGIAALAFFVCLSIGVFFFFSFPSSLLFRRSVFVNEEGVLVEAAAGWLNELTDGLGGMDLDLI